MNNLLENPIRSLLSPGVKELTPLEKIAHVLQPWESVKSYPGPSWCGIERIHLALATVVKVLAIEVPTGNPWYKYKSSNRSDSDGKDWRLVVPTNPAVAINFHSLLHDKRWTVVTTIFKSKDIDPEQAGKLIGHSDPWIRSMLWTIKLAKSLETTGYDYKPSLDSMVKRLQLVNELRQLKNCMEPDVIAASKKYGAQRNDGQLPNVSLAINSWRTGKGRVGTYEKPANGRDFGIITIDSEIMSSPEYMQEVIRHELVHAVLNENCRNNTHGPTFQNIAKEIGLPRQYRD